jgi:hypothetical protein
MWNWLRRIDDSIFSPPHKFETILALVALKLGLDFEDESHEPGKQDAPSEQTPPQAHQPS